MNRVHAAVKAIILRDNTFLVIKQKIGDETAWDFPGGRIQFGESPYDALIREVQEETGMIIQIARPLGLFWFYRKQDGEQVVCTTFVCNLISQNNTIDLTKNISIKEQVIEYRWITKEEFLEDSFIVPDESMKKLIEIL